MSALHVLHMCIGTSLSLVHLTALDYDLRIFFIIVQLNIKIAEHMLYLPIIIAVPVS